MLTHAHEDHIGAIPFLLKMRADIPVVGSKFTLALVAAKCREHRVNPVFIEVAEGQRSTHGVFECQYFAVNHSIPDALAIAIHTGAGTVLHTGDIKLDQLRLTAAPPIFPACHGSAIPGWTCSCAIDKLRDPGCGPLGKRSRTQHPPADPRRPRPCHRGVLRLERRPGAADRRCVRRTGPQSVVRGPVDVLNMGIARELGYLHFNDDDVVDIAMAEMLAPERVALVTTGTQGEPMAALSRMSRGEHRSITLTSGDLIILSSSQIPGTRKRSTECSMPWPRSARALSPIPCPGPCFRPRILPVNFCSSITGCGHAM